VTARAPAAIVVMGVSGCGKTTLASHLAQRLGWNFAEADTFHSLASVEKMRSGIPLTDEDRWPWLDAIAGSIEIARKQSRPCVVACSALRRVYRERLAGGHDDVRFVYLQGDYDTIAGRMAGRSGHYMPPTLLSSQFDTLEEPGSEERPIVVSIDLPPAVQVDQVLALLELR
jgi:gluconokinase